MEEPEVWKELEGIGEDKVRTMVGLGHYQEIKNKVPVQAWLSKKERERSDANARSSAADARSANLAAWTAAIAAIIAAIMAMLDKIASFMK